MEIAGFAAGVLFSAAQYMLARKVFYKSGRLQWGALYIVQRLILSFGLLALMILISATALLYSAVGLIVTAIALPLIFNRKG